MYILPAMDLYGGKVVRLYKGDYRQMTVYSDEPLSVARAFEAAGAAYVHIVDLEGARDGSTPNFDTVAAVARGTNLQVEVGGGVRREEIIRRYLDAGVRRVILGSAAVTNWDFFTAMAAKYGASLAAGVDCRDGLVAIHGWQETSSIPCLLLCQKLQTAGVGAVICTDISKDGAMLGTNRELYQKLTATLKMDIIASGGVSTLADVAALRDMGLYGVIIGKAYYTGAVRLQEALEVAK